MNRQRNKWESIPIEHRFTRKWQRTPLVYINIFLYNMLGMIVRYIRYRHVLKGGYRFCTVDIDSVYCWHYVKYQYRFCILLALC